MLQNAAFIGTVSRENSNTNAGYVLEDGETSFHQSSSFPSLDTKEFGRAFGLSDCARHLAKEGYVTFCRRLQDPASEPAIETGQCEPSNKVQC